uniref:Ribosome biogenesis protein SLX9 n=1 Tax=Panstrongylus lignarius TaxID=156445 RepID=A0A224XJY2_9HEMI
MGKVRRKRTQYHFSSNKKDEETTSNNNQPDDDGGVSGFNINVPEDIFKDVKIDVDEVNRNLNEDDSRSIKTVRSISKSVKSFKKSLGDIHLKKADKRTLRRNLFLKKIQLSQANLNRGKKNGKEKVSDLYSISEIDKLLPKVDMVFHNPKVSNGKQPSQITAPKIRGILKAKDRKKAMINNMDGFKKLLNDTNFKSNLMDVVSSSIQQKVFTEEV